jgi:hypothetical protein
MAAEEDEVGRERRRERKRKRKRRCGGKTRSTRTRGRGGMQSAQLLDWILKAHRD